jgi:hypothetical protein
MSTGNKSSLSLLSAALLGTALVAVVPTVASAQAPNVKANEIGGVVTGANGPEAGVWVIAETTDLPTKYVRIVATDDQGRYLIPDLPRGSYTVWARGYGLVDSAKAKTDLGKAVNIKSVAAPNEAAAAEYYPAIYWYSMLKIPEASLFPGTGPTGNGMPITLKDQGQWVRFLKTDSCNSCHQIGDKATRVLEPQLGKFASSAAAWERRIQSGQASNLMVNGIGNFDTARALANFGDWTDRIAKGELPFAKPSRPTGIERNILVTEWDWNTPTGYLHDEISTDRRDPKVNAHGLIYGSPEDSSDYIPWLDPVDNKAGLIKSEYRDPKTPTSKNNPQFNESPYWGAEAVWDSHTAIHNPWMDEKGRLWLTARIRPANEEPAFCKAGSNHPSAKAFPLTRSGRQLEVYDPQTKKATPIDLCFSTHHLQLDKGGVMWFSSGNPADLVEGWFDTKKWDATHDEAASQGWAPFVIDVNGNGKVDDYAGLNDPIDPKKDKLVQVGFYGASPSPADGMVWASYLGFPGGVVRFDPKTKLTEFYEVPYKDAKNPNSGFSPRGMDVDGNGVVWSALASGHLASFDRKLCKGPLTGAIATTGKACPEGWKLYALPGPQFKGLAVADGSVEAPYYDWVDQFDTLGLGKNIPIATGNQSDALFPLVDGKFVTMRVPYPMGYFAKGMDGRVDDPTTGWKGKGIFSTYSGRSGPHIEGGKGTTSKVVHFQLRPNPLAD